MYLRAVEKLVVVGDMGVGKTNIISRWVEGKYNDRAVCTIGVDFSTKRVQVHDQEVTVQIWDTAGQERHRAVPASTYHGVSGAILVYDISKAETFDHLQLWLQELKRYCPASAKILLVGNKSDQVETRAVSSKTAEQYAIENGLHFLETSAKDATNIDKAFEYIVKQITADKQAAELAAQHNVLREGGGGDATNRRSIVLDRDGSKPKTNRCCSMV